MLYPWTRAVCSLGLMTLGSAGFYGSIVILKPVAEEFDVSRSAASLAYAMCSAGIGVGGLFMGWWSDRIGVMIPAIVGAFCVSAGLVLASASTELWQFVLFHGVLIGLLGNSSVMVSLIADITRWFHGQRGMAVAVVISGNYLAGALWPAIIQYGVDNIGWRGTYARMGVACLLGMIPLSLVMWRRARIVDDVGGTLPGNPTRPMGLSPATAQCLLCAAGIGCCVAMAVPQAHIVAHATDLGHPAARAAEMLALMLGCGIVSRLAYGWLSDRIGGLRTLIAGSVMQAIVLASFIPITGLQALYWACALFGLSQGGIVPAYALILRRHFPASEIGGRVGLIMLSTLIGMAFGAWVAGALYDLTGSYRAAFTNAIAFNALNLVIATVLLARTHYGRMA